MKDIWVRNILTTIENECSEELAEQIMAGCGENCPFSHMPDDEILELKEQSSGEEELMELLGKHWRLQQEGEKYYIVFDRCFCPMVMEDTSSVSPVLCYCTLGSLKKKFKLALGRDVDVTMETTVLRGDPRCRFQIHV